METTIEKNDCVLVSMERLHREIDEAVRNAMASFVESEKESVNHLAKEEDPENVFLDVPEVCSFLRISKTTLWRLEKDGDLKATRTFGRKKVYTKSDVIRAGKGL